jgi:electron transport complex protein RnfB
MTDLVARIHAALPQTQCTRCGYPDCRAYAHAIAHDDAPINQCPPGGAEGIERLGQITGRPAGQGLNPDNGQEGPRKTVYIDEAWCIGCTLCIKACPTDAIVGSHKTMHTVLEASCTGCELCLPVCPVDCILTEDATPGRRGWAAWSQDLANQSLRRYTARQARLRRDDDEHRVRKREEAERKLADLAAASHITDPQQLDLKRQRIQAALAKARARPES